MLNPNTTRKFIFYCCVVLNCLPLLLLLILTFSTSWPYPHLMPKTLSFSFIEYVFLNNITTLKAFITSVIIGVASSLLAIIIGVPTAKAVVLYNFPGKKIISLMILLPLIVPAITVTTGIHVAMIKMKLSGTMLGVTLIHTVFMLPYAIRTLINVFEVIGDKFENQAIVLGANRFQVFRYITLPLIMPGILSAAVLCFAISLSQYITTFLIGGGKIVTVSMLLIPYIQSGEVQTASVYSLIFVFVSVVMLIMMEKIVKTYYNLSIEFYG